MHVHVSLYFPKHCKNEALTGYLSQKNRIIPKKTDLISSPNHPQTIPKPDFHDLPGSTVLVKAVATWQFHHLLGEHHSAVLVPVNDLLGR